MGCRGEITAAGVQSTISQLRDRTEAAFPARWPNQGSKKTEPGVGFLNPSGARVARAVLKIVLCTWKLVRGAAAADEKKEDF